MAKKQAETAPAPTTSGQEYPKTKYRKSKVTTRRPDGYEARQVADAEAEEALGKNWVDSPDDL